MSDEKTGPMANHVPIVGEIVEDGRVVPLNGNRVFTRDEMEKAFGPHPMRDWKPEIRRRLRRR